MTLLVERPNLSIVAIDPGSTTGVAVYDGATGAVFVEQLDFGTGVRMKDKVHGGFTESVNRAFVINNLYGRSWWERRGHGAKGEANVINELESMAVTILLDIVLACGPNTVIVMEDFILGYGDASRAKSSARAGLSPVRMQSRFHDRASENGYFNGDAWRDWEGFGATGVDGRGLTVKWKNGVAPGYKDRLADVQKWRLGGGTWGGAWEDPGDGGGGIWRGGGARYLLQMPGKRLFVGGDERKTADWLRAAGLWKPGFVHAMDAMMHLMSLAVSFGWAIQGPWERIYAMGRKSDRKGDLTISRN